MKTRQAAPADALLLSSLCREVQRLHAQHHPDIFKAPQDDAFAISFFEETLADPKARIFIAEEDGRAVGYIFFKLVERPENPFTFAARVLHIDQISVSPTAQGQGIGRALMQQAEISATKWDAERIQLDSWDFNVAAHGFFEHLEFEKFHFRFWRKLS